MIGQTILHYKILEKLGEGGMGVVYKAQDTKLDRFVALKFLPAHQSASEQDKARFIQEAKAASALNHPNVATVYEINEVDGQMFIAMEFVDGSTLRDRKQTLSMKQVIDIAVQIADGLSAAHEQGIIHRDIKPENIMVRKDGIVQIMDFGLAKLRGVTKLTKEGSTLGTIGYMSPEQVQGLDTDHRTDIFSMGVVLYELLAGHLPFKGIHETAIMYEIVNVDPEPLSAVRQDVEPELDRIILECLEKERDERYQSVKEVSKDLKRFKRESSRQNISRKSIVRQAYPAPGSSAEVVARPVITLPAFRREWISWIISAIILMIFGMITFLRSGSETQIIRSHLLPPPGIVYNSQGGSQISVSPNGRMLAFVGTDSTGKNYLFIRRFNFLTAQQLPGTEGAVYPFWSPDNKFIGFFMANKLKKVDVNGGPPLTLCDAPAGRGGSWNKKGMIVFSPDQVGGISRVPAVGGTPTVITKLDSTHYEQTHRWPQFLPDGKHFLYFARSSAGGTDSEGDAMCVATVDGKTNKRIFSLHSNSVYSNGFLVYLRDRALIAQPFDISNLQVSGDPAPIAEQVQYDVTFTSGVFSTSENSVLVYQTGVAQSGYSMLLFDRNGKQLNSVTDPGIYFGSVFSRDGKKIAAQFADPQSRNQDIWVFDLVHGIKSRLTFDPAVDRYPVWSPDGSNIIFSSDRKGFSDIYQKVSNGAANEVLLFESKQNKNVSDWSGDGKNVLFTTVADPKTKNDIWVLPLAGDQKPFPFLKTDFNEVGAHFSPDGRWVAYSSDESGKSEVYIRPFPGAGGKWQVSVNGGGNPRWRQDGKEIYYISPDSKLMVGNVKVSDTSLEIGSVRPLFDMQSKGLVFFDDVTGDGQRFLFRVAAGGHTSNPLILVTNWTEDLKKK